MIILQITQLKNFMNTLLRLETFDRFPVSEASITTFTTFSIDGSLHTDFFDPDDAQLLKEKGRTRLLWKDVKSFCYSVIKGKRTPLQFKFVFQLPQAACEKMIADHALPLEIENVFGCFLNFQYKDGKLLLTTGTSLKIFTMDKSLDRVFDEEVRQFLLKNEIAFEEQIYRQNTYLERFSFYESDYYVDHGSRRGTRRCRPDRWQSLRIWKTV